MTAPTARVLRGPRVRRGAGDPHGVEPATRTERRRRTLLIALVVGLAATGLRLYAIRQSYNLFIDEVSYTGIARNLASGDGLTLYGRPFLLHPPGAFFGYAAVIELFGLGGSTLSVIMHLRVVSALAGGAVCAAGFLLVDRAASRRAALVAAAIVGLDPFLVRFDSLVMLEAPAQLATVAMIGFLSLRLSNRSPGPDRTAGQTRRRWTLTGAGISLALAMSTKATFGLVAGLTLVILFATGWVIQRREAARVLAVGVTGYLLVIVVSASTWGSLSGWFSTQWHGLGRLVGVHQETGFNAPTTQVTLSERIAANLGQYGVTYALLAVGGAAALAVIWRSKPWRAEWTSAAMKPRLAVLIAVWAISACAYLGYAIVAGSLEEQMFYIMVLPIATCFCTWLDQVWPRWSLPLRVVAAVAIAAALLVNGTVWERIHHTHDDVYQQFFAWETESLPTGRVIAVTEFTSQFLIQDQVIGQWATVPELQLNHVDYVLVVTTLVEQGYGLGTPAFLTQLDAQTPLLFRARARDGGELRLYDVRSLTGGSER